MDTQKLIDWAHLAKRFPMYREHIMRIRKNQAALRLLRVRLENKFHERLHS